jgi:hypothetical protein
MLAAADAPLAVCCGDCRLVTGSAAACPSQPKSGGGASAVLTPQTSTPGSCLTPWAPRSQCPCTARPPEMLATPAMRVSGERLPALARSGAQGSTCFPNPSPTPGRGRRARRSTRTRRARWRRCPWRTCPTCGSPSTARRAARRARPVALPLPALGLHMRSQAWERPRCVAGRVVLGHAVSPGSPACPHALLEDGRMHCRATLGPGRSCLHDGELAEPALTLPYTHRSLTPARPAGDVGRAAARAGQAARVHAVAALHPEELPAAHQPAPQRVPGTRAPGPGVGRGRGRGRRRGLAGPASAAAAACRERPPHCTRHPRAARPPPALRPERQLPALGGRRARALRRRSARAPAPAGRRRGRRRARARAQVEGVSDVRQARGLPVYTVGSCSVQGLRNLLSHVRSPPTGPLPPPAPAWRPWWQGTLQARSAR